MYSHLTPSRCTSQPLHTPLCHIFPSKMDKTAIFDVKERRICVQQGPPNSVRSLPSFCAATRPNRSNIYRKVDTHFRLEPDFVVYTVCAVRLWVDAAVRRRCGASGVGADAVFMRDDAGCRVGAAVCAGSSSTVYIQSLGFSVFCNFFFSKHHPPLLTPNADGFA